MIASKALSDINSFLENPNGKCSQKGNERLQQLIKKDLEITSKYGS